jgi:exopolysaccharide biosynthesis polyprenyl glycosylphosphotransferase
VSTSASQLERVAGNADCAARLISGQAIPRRNGRKPPRSIAANGLSRVACEERSFQPPGTIAELVLPTPGADGNRWRLWTALVADYALILTSWALVSVLDFLVELRAIAAGSSASVARIFPSSQVAFALLFAVLATLLGFSEGLYQPGIGRNRRRQAAILGKSVGWSAFLLIVGFRLSGGTAASSSRLLLGAGLSLVSLLAWRRRHQRAHSSKLAGHGQARNVLIVGAGPAGREVAAYLAQHPELGRSVRGFVDDNSVPALGVLGSIENLATIARAEFVDEVILAVPHRRDLTQFVIREARKNHLDVKVIPDLFGCEIHDPWIETVGTIPLVTLHREELPAAELFAKRALDVTVSACALVFALPLMLLIAVLIRLDSPGPVTYAAMRVGRKGKRFPCYKFRTMVANANEIKETLRRQNQREGPCFKIADDPRITRIGRWLRRYSLDELPQLWNVLKGEMSLVGPRPHPLDDFARYQLEHLRRLDVTPGITGLWQVTARGCPSFHTNMALDLEYIERWSLGLDLRILLKTLSVVVHGTGA